MCDPVTCECTATAVRLGKGRGGLVIGGGPGSTGPHSAWLLLPSPCSPGEGKGQHSMGPGNSLSLKCQDGDERVPAIITRSPPSLCSGPRPRLPGVAAKKQSWLILGPGWCGWPRTIHAGRPAPLTADCNSGCSSSVLCGTCLCHQSIGLGTASLPLQRNGDRTRGWGRVGCPGWNRKSGQWSHRQTGWLIHNQWVARGLQSVSNTFTSSNLHGRYQ